MFSDGTKAGLLYIPAGGSRCPATQRTVEERMHYIKMNGPEVFKFAVTVMIDSTLHVLEMWESSAELAYLIPHQANERIINSLTKNGFKAGAGFD